MYSKANTFSHLYVEEAVAESARARRIIGRFPRSTVVMIDDYKNVFGRGRQDFWRQKASPKLILAAKKDNLLYPGNGFLQENAYPNFCYNALVLNCPYDCHYCYLQGMYPGANVVAFVNLEAYFEAVERFIEARPDPREPVRLAISYDTDLLALEGILGYVREWTEWSRGQEAVEVEVRTKSARGRFFREVEASPRIRMAWTLSPASVCERYESGAPPLSARLEALAAAVEAGWRVSLCLDPVLKVPDWERVYGDFLDELAAAVPWAAVERVEVGVFRVGVQAFRRMRKRPDTDLLQYPFEHASNAVSYKGAVRAEMMELLRTRLARTISPTDIYLWT